MIAERASDLIRFGALNEYEEEKEKEHQHYDDYIANHQAVASSVMQQTLANFYLQQQQHQSNNMLDSLQNYYQPHHLVLTEHTNSSFVIDGSASSW